MHRYILISAVAFVGLAGFLDETRGQQFRVYTEVTVPKRDASPKDAPEDVVARSLTIFHAGRTFDWLQTAGEVTIFEPAHERFIIFNGRKLIATTVEFDEINRRLSAARDETRNHAQRLEARSDREARAIARALHFQLDPDFKYRFQPSERRLELTSPQLSYNVQCGAAHVPEAVERYLNYADWTARLNHVMHPRSLYPAPRLKLNESLRQHEVIPVRVRLRVDFDQPLVLQAQHRFSWELETVDRQQIQYWEDRIDDQSLEWLSFREYQRATLGKSAQARR